MVSQALFSAEEYSDESVISCPQGAHHQVEKNTQMFAVAQGRMLSVLYVIWKKWFMSWQKKNITKYYKNFMEE